MKSAEDWRAHVLGIEWQGLSFREGALPFSTVTEGGIWNRQEWTGRKEVRTLSAEGLWGACGA